MIPEINPYNNWSGNGSTTTFDFDFYIEDETQLAVYHTDSDGVQTTLTLDTDYSINEVGNENGSYITFPLSSSSYDVLGEDEIISLCLTLPISQENEFGKSSYLNLETLEYSLDYLTRICQIMNRELERSVKTQEGAEESAEELMESLQEAQVNAANSASAAAASAEEAASSLTSASESAASASEVLSEVTALKEELEEDIENLADRDLSNLSDTGEARFDNKANIDADNFSSTGYDTLSGLSFPFENYIELTAGSSGTALTAPADGWFMAEGDTSGNGFIALNYYDMGYPESNLGSYAHHNQSGNAIRCILPVSKGKQVTLTYSSTLEINCFIFAYAQGAEIEESET